MEREKIACSPENCPKLVQCIDAPTFSCISYPQQQICAKEENLCSQIEEICVNQEAVCVFNVEVCIATDVDGKCVQLEQHCEKLIETCLEWDYECKGSNNTVCVVFIYDIFLTSRNTNQ
jgi:hypothetical protein